MYYLLLDEVHVLPLSFSEYYAFNQGDKGDAYDDYSVYGGYQVDVGTRLKDQMQYMIEEN